MRVRNHQVVAGADRVAAQPVDLAQHGRRRLIAFGDAADRLAAADAVPRPLHALALAERRERRRECVGLLERQQQPVRAFGIGRPAVDAGVQRVERLRVDAGELGRQRHVDLAAGLDDGEPRLVAQLGQRDAEAAAGSPTSSAIASRRGT